MCPPQRARRFHAPKGDAKPDCACPAPFCPETRPGPAETPCPSCLKAAAAAFARQKAVTSTVREQTGTVKTDAAFSPAEAIYPSAFAAAEQPRRCRALPTHTLLPRENGMTIKDAVLRLSSTWALETSARERPTPQPEAISGKPPQHQRSCLSPPRARKIPAHSPPAVPRTPSLNSEADPRAPEGAKGVGLVCQVREKPTPFSRLSRC